MLSAIILFIIFCLLYIFRHVVRYEQRRKRNNYVPGFYDFPIIGSSAQLAYTAGLTGPHWQRIHKVCQARGKTMSTRTVAYNFLITEDPEVVKEITNSPDWTDRFPEHPQFKELTLYKQLGIMFSNGEAQRDIRKFTIRTLRTFGFGELKTSEELIQIEIDNLFKILEKERLNFETRGEILMRHKFKAPTFNVLWMVMAGERFTPADTKIVQLIDAVEDVTKINIGLDPEWAFPILRYIPGCSPSRAKYPSFVICHDFFKNELKSRREVGTYRENQNNFIDYFLSKLDEEKTNPATFYTDEQFQVTCVDLLFGGIETTGNLLEFSLLYMTKFPEIQRKVQAELDLVIGHDRRPTFSDKSKLKYVEAVLLEALRWACIVPINARTSNCDTKAGKYNVPKGTMCAMNLTVVHWSKEVWGDPENFRPERFLNENNEIVNSDKIFPFGGGKRSCPGYLMAKVLWISFFTALMQRYEFSPAQTHPHLKTHPSPGVANNPKPFYVTLTPRCDVLQKS